MKTRQLTLLLCLSFVLAGTAASAGSTGPAGIGTIAYGEKVKAKGCGTYSAPALVELILNGDGTWVADAPFGEFSGTLSPADSKGRTWNLVFDSGSLALYEAFLEEVATELCETPVNVTGIQFSAFQLKFAKDLSEVAVQIKSAATGSTAFGAGSGSHGLKGKGVFVPD